MMKKEKLIAEVHSAVRAEIESFVGAYKTTKGLLEYLQGKEWRFPNDDVEKYYGKGAHYFDIFDTQKHLEEFINKDKIFTIITFTISNDELAAEFADYLEEECRAWKADDQSTYLSSCDRKEIEKKISKKEFSFGEGDHVTLYYCEGMDSNFDSMPLTEQIIIENKTI